MEERPFASSARRESDQRCEDAPQHEVAESDVAAVVVNRIDRAHPVGETTGDAADEPASSCEAVDEHAANEHEQLLATAGRSAPHLAEQLHTQAIQLASHLRTKQSELDRREALLNARDARVENDLRMARLWLREREHELQQRQAELVERQAKLEEDAAQFAALEVSADRDHSSQQVQLALRVQACEEERRELAQKRERLTAEQAALHSATERLEQRRVELSTEQLHIQQQLAMQRLAQEQTLAQQLRKLEIAGQALEAREQALEARRDELTNGRSRQAWESRLAARERELTQAEQLLARHMQELEASRVQLAAEREQWRQEAKSERRAIAERAQRERAALLKRQQQLQVSQQALDSHRSVVEQLRADAAKMHREGLEMRLVAEQLWLELVQHVPAAELTRSLSGLRSRLAEHYRTANRELTSRQAELVELGQRLQEQQTRLTQQREEVRAWRDVQQREIEVQAARLVARERELDEQERAASSHAQRWSVERRELQQQIRELLARLRVSEPRETSRAA